MKLTGERKQIFDSLYECYLLIEANTKGLVIDEKDTARIYLMKYGYICKGDKRGTSVFKSVKGSASARGKAGRPHRDGNNKSVRSAN